MIVYLAGPDDVGIEKALWNAGHSVVNARGMGAAPARARLVTACDAVVFDGTRSNLDGDTLEDLAVADKHGIPVHMELPGLHFSESVYPVQFDEMRAVLGKLYRTALDKNADYGPGNLALTGTIGVAVRLGDKVCRLLNLLGFRFEVKYGGFTDLQHPKFESLDDTLMDAANYAVMGLLLRRGAWGK